MQTSFSYFLFLFLFKTLLLDGGIETYVVLFMQQTNDFNKFSVDSNITGNVEVTNCMSGTELGGNELKFKRNGKTC